MRILKPIKLKNDDFVWHALFVECANEAVHGQRLSGPADCCQLQIMDKRAMIVA